MWQTCLPRLEYQDIKISILSSCWILVWLCYTILYLQHSTLQGLDYSISHKELRYNYLIFKFFSGDTKYLMIRIRLIELVNDTEKSWSRHIVQPTYFGNRSVEYGTHWGETWLLQYKESGSLIWTLETVKFSTYFIFMKIRF